MILISPTTTNLSEYNVCTDSFSELLDITLHFIYNKLDHQKLPNEYRVHTWSYSVFDLSLLSILLNLLLIVTKRIEK